MQVTVLPFEAPLGAAAGPLSLTSCLIPKDIRSFSMSTSRILASTVSPFLKSLSASSPDLSQERSDKCAIPSMSPSRPINSPNSVTERTSPLITVPAGKRSVKLSHGLSCTCLMPREMRRFSSSTSKTSTSTSCELDTIFPGCTFFFVQDISETCTSPSTPSSSSINAP